MISVDSGIKTIIGANYTVLKDSCFFHLRRLMLNPQPQLVVTVHCDGGCYQDVRNIPSFPEYVSRHTFTNQYAHHRQRSSLKG